MTGIWGIIPTSTVHYTCEDCEVGWAAPDGTKCWYCGRPSFTREYVIVWFMKKHNKPLWRTGADISTGSTA